MANPRLGWPNTPEKSMLLRLKTLTRSTRLALAQWLRRAPAAAPVAGDDMAETEAVYRAQRQPFPWRPVVLTLGTAAIAAGAGYLLIQHLSLIHI